jgi:hypothetical protein
MTSKQFRFLSSTCCLAAVVLTIVGMIGYQARKQSVEEWNTQGAGGASLAMEFRAPMETTKFLLIAGILMALSGCLHLKSIGGGETDAGVGEES